MLCVTVCFDWNQIGIDEESQKHNNFIVYAAWSSFCLFSSSWYVALFEWLCVKTFMPSIMFHKTAWSMAIYYKFCALSSCHFTLWAWLPDTHGCWTMHTNYQLIHMNSAISMITTRQSRLCHSYHNYSVFDVYSVNKSTITLLLQWPPVFMWYSFKLSKSYLITDFGSIILWWQTRDGILC